MFPHATLFYSTLLLSTIMALSANQWLFIWVALELNLLSFLPLLTSTQRFQETEGAVKYFLAQALGSGLILLGAASLTVAPIFALSLDIANLAITMGILIKLGVPPCHFWFPRVMASLPWSICLVLSTWQKLIPINILFVLTYSSSFPLIITLVAAISALVGGIGGINQTHLRPLLAYSSITHIRWILATAPCSSSAATFYLIAYIIINLTVIMFLSSRILFSAKKISNIFPLDSFSKSAILISLLSLAGLPPLFGFIPKWVALVHLSLSNQVALALVLILGSLFRLYYYLSLFFSLSLTPVQPLFLYGAPITTHSSIPLLLLSTLTLGLCPTLMFISLYAMTLLYKSQRYWHSLFHFWDLRGPIRHLNKSPHPGRTWATRLPFRKRPTL